MTEILTTETLQVWSSNPVTVEIIKRVKAAVLAEQSISYYRKGQSADSYGLDCAYSQGLIDGAEAFLEAFNNIKFEFGEDEAENNE